MNPLIKKMLKELEKQEITEFEYYRPTKTNLDHRVIFLGKNINELRIVGIKFNLYFENPIEVGEIPVGDKIIKLYQSVLNYKTSKIR